MLTRILYPVDLSPRSQKGLAWIANRVLQKQSTLVAVHVVSPAAGLDTPRYVHDAEVTLDTLCNTIVAPDISCKVIATAGNLEEVLPDIAHRENCSFAILPVLTGESILPLVRQMAIPQFLLRTGNGDLPEEDVFTRIVIALDLSPERTDLLLTRVKDILSDSDISSTIHLLHGLPLEDAEGSQNLVNAATQALEEVRSEVSKWNPHTLAEVISGQPEEELPKRITEIRPTLLVVGLATHGEMWQLILGSTAEALIDRTACPVLIIPT